MSALQARLGSLVSFFSTHELTVRSPPETRELIGIIIGHTTSLTSADAFIVWWMGNYTPSVVEHVEFVVANTYVGYRYSVEMS